jgi:hypothetical protein
MSAIPCSSVSLKTMADGTLRISFDIEPKDAQDAFKLFAAPGTPAAIAALQVGYEQKVDTSPERVQKTPESIHVKGGPLAKLAGMWCNENEFFYFIRPVYDVFMGGDGRGYGNVSPGEFGDVVPAYCAHCIKAICGINSRAELDHDPVAAEKFHTLIRGPYQKHLMARGIVA